MFNIKISINNFALVRKLHHIHRINGLNVAVDWPSTKTSNLKNISFLTAPDKLALAQLERLLKLPHIRSFILEKVAKQKKPFGLAACRDKEGRLEFFLVKKGWANHLELERPLDIKMALSLKLTDPKHFDGTWPEIES